MYKHVGHVFCVGNVETSFGISYKATLHCTEQHLLLIVIHTLTVICYLWCCLWCTVCVGAEVGTLSGVCGWGHSGYKSS